jgi:hypothetical protein
MDRKTVGKLQLAFWNGYEVPAACLYAGIAQEDYEREVAADRDFGHCMKKAQMYPRVKAQVEMVRCIANGDGQLARKYLETHEPERYNVAYIARFGRASDEE